MTDIQGEAVETAREDEDAAADEAYDAWDAVLRNRECHRVQWTLEPDRVRGRIVCEGIEDAGCHYYCAEDCEVYPCGHPPTLGKMCGVEPWFDDGAECYYDGPEVSAHDGPVELIWDGDGYSWRYAEARRPVAGSPVHPDQREAIADLVTYLAIFAATILGTIALGEWSVSR